jgi:cytochrome P450
MSMAPVDLIDPIFAREPTKGFGRLREQAPVVAVRFPGVDVPTWLVLRYEAVKAALAEPRFVMDRGNVPGIEGPSPMDELMTAIGVPDEYRFYLRSMLSMDGKAHTRLRSLVAPAFTARRTNVMRPYVERVAAQLMDSVRDKGVIDLIADFSVPLAGTIISELIGIDEADRSEVGNAIHNYSDSNPSKILESAHQLVAYTKGLIARRRAKPGTDVVSALLQAVGEDGDKLTDDEVISVVMVLIHTGHHATSHFMPAAALKLMDHPDELARLRAEPKLLSQAVEELLRTASPVTIGAPMYVTEDFEFAGAPLKRGNVVLACLVSANHDPRVFTEPERFDVTRAAAINMNLSFYHGPHYCLASSLARLESEVAIDYLFLRDDKLSLAVPRDQVKYHPNPSGSLLARLPVRVQGGARPTVA